MNVTYKVLSLEDAIKQALPTPWGGNYSEDDDNNGDADWRGVLYKCEDDVPVEALATDGGEPEDFSFHRDLSWIPGALSAAYQLGAANAIETLAALSKSNE